ncbi:MAG: type II secretion system secretin GspD [Myxococcota bacterium]|nr:type II secretion system secretin GspD [Myxococcota bacterium]
MQNLSQISRRLGLGAFLALTGLALPGAAFAQDKDLDDSRNKPPCATPATVTLDYVEYDVQELVKYMAETSCRNLILGGDELKGKVTIISHKPVPYWSAFAAMESALATAGYTMVEVGGTYKVLPTSEAAQAPVAVYEGTTIPATDRVVTQIFQLDNVQVSDISSIAKEMAGPKAKIIAYVPTNTLIVTDSAYNIRRMWKVVGQLDVEAPKSEIHVVQIKNATASEIKTLIETIYGTSENESSSSTTTSSSTSNSAAARRRRRRNRDAAAAASTEASASNVGKQGSYIEKIVADDRTNRLIILANDAAMEKVQELIDELDADVDPANRAKIHVVYLEHAKAEDVASTLAALSQGSSNNATTRRTTQTARNGRTIPQPDAAAEGSPSVTALLDDDVRITADENTNSLVIVASPEAFRILKNVIDQLDIRRKQVFVEVVIMEMATDDSTDLGLSYHTGIPGDSATTVLSSQMGPSSLGVSTDLLSGVAMGVFGDTIPVTVDGTSVDLPAFGVVVNALQANSQVNILSTPNIMTLDNEEAEIVVGRNVPFPTSQGRDSNNNPIISFTREDVAITLRVTPQINESDYVTLEVYQEVTEIEDSASSSSSDVTLSGGPTTSKRTAETTVLVRDNQTVVIGGLMSSTDSEIETKVPLLGDLPLIGVLFRSTSKSSRKTNLLIFLTPHVIDDPGDLEEVYRVKVAQREEFLRRFYGKSELEQAQALDELLSYSMNIIDDPSGPRYSATFTDEDGTETYVNGGAEGEEADAAQDTEMRTAGDPIPPADVDPDAQPEDL